MPGLCRALVQVAVQRGRRVGVGCGEGQLRVSGGQRAAQRRGHRRLVSAVPEGGGEAALAHREGAVFGPARRRGGEGERNASPPEARLPTPLGRRRTERPGRAKGGKGAVLGARAAPLSRGCGPGTRGPSAALGNSLGRSAASSDVAGASQAAGTWRLAGRGRAERLPSPAPVSGRRELLSDSGLDGLGPEAASPSRPAASPEAKGTSSRSWSAA